MFKSQMETCVKLCDSKYLLVEKFEKVLFGDCFRLSPALKAEEDRERKEEERSERLA